MAHSIYGLTKAKERLFSKSGDSWSKFLEIKPNIIFSFLLSAVHWSLILSVTVNGTEICLVFYSFKLVFLILYLKEGLYYLSALPYIYLRYNSLATHPSSRPNWLPLIEKPCIIVQLLPYSYFLCHKQNWVFSTEYLNLNHLRRPWTMNIVTGYGCYWRKPYSHQIYNVWRPALLHLQEILFLSPVFTSSDREATTLFPFFMSLPEVSFSWWCWWK